MSIVKRSHGYKVDSRVSIALDALDDVQKRAIGSVITDRDHFIQNIMDPRKVQRLSERDSLYSLKIPSGLRIIYSRKGEDIEVIDLMRQVTLDRFGRKTAKTKNVKTKKTRTTRR